MKNESQNKTCWRRKREREDRLSLKKTHTHTITVYNTPGVGKISFCCKFSFYSKDYVEHCFILLFMNFIFFLALKHIYAAASFPPVPVQHEYSQSPYRLQMCTHTHTQMHTHLHHTQISASWSLGTHMVREFPNICQTNARNDTTPTASGEFMCGVCFQPLE